MIMDLHAAVTAYGKIVARLTASEAHEVETVRAAKIAADITAGMGYLEARISGLRFARSYAESIIWDRV
jgi:hypothetical protein